MTSDNTFERAWKLETSARQLVLEGKRKPEAYIELLQKFVFGAVLPDIDWSKVYSALGMEAKYKETTLFADREDPSLWFVPVLEGVTCSKVVAALRKLGVDVYVYVDDLDKEVSKNDRDAKSGCYVTAFRRTIEADEENASKSANDLAKSGHKGITLLERLLLELGYFLATGQHLDVKNVTLCTGSRYSDGFVPDGAWSSDYRKVYVSWCSPAHSHDDLRSRSVVS